MQEPAAPAVAPDIASTDVRRVITVDGVGAHISRIFPQELIGRSHASCLGVAWCWNEWTDAVMFSGMDKKKASAEKFIAVYPDGTGTGMFLTWNTGGTGGSKVDDVKFLNAVIDDLALVTKIDPRRIFATEFPMAA